MHFQFLLLSGLGLAAALAVPETTPKPDIALAKRATPITNESQLNASLAAITKSGGGAYPSGFSALYNAIVPSAAPTDSGVAMSRISSAYAAHPSDPLGAGAEILLQGVSGQNPFGNPIVDASNFGACNGYANVNPAPPKPVYPKKSASDPAYDVSEASLRAAIYFPPGYAKVPSEGSSVQTC